MVHGGLLMTSEVTTEPIFELNGLYNQCPNASLAPKGFSELNEAKLGAKLARSLVRRESPVTRIVKAS